MDDAAYNALLSKMSTAVSVNEQLSSILPLLFELTKKVSNPSAILSQECVIQLNAHRDAASSLLSKNSSLQSSVTSLESSLASLAVEQTSSLASISSLESSLASLQSDLTSSQHSYAALSSTSSLTTADLHSQLASQSLSLSSLSRELSQKSDALSDILSSHAALEAEASSLHDSLVSLASENKSLSHEIDGGKLVVEAARMQAEAAREAARATLVEREKERGEAKERDDEAKRREADLKDCVATERRRADGAETDLRNVRKGEEEARADAEAARKDLQEAKEQTKKEKRLRQGAEADSANCKATIQDLEARGSALADKLEEESKLKCDTASELKKARLEAEEQRALLTKERDEARDLAKKEAEAFVAAQADVAKLKHCLSTLSSEKVDMILDLKSKSESLFKLDAELATLRSEKDAAVQRSSILSANADATALTVLGLERRVSETTSKASDLALALATTTQDLEESRSALGSSKDALVKGQKANAERCVDLSQRLAALGGENALLQGAVARFTGESAALTEDLRSTKARLEAVCYEAKATTTTRDEALKGLAACHLKISTMETDVAKLVKEREETTTKARRAAEDVERANALTKKAVEERGGFEELYREGEVKVCEMAEEVATLKEQIKKMMGDKKTMKGKVEEAEVTRQEMKREIDDAYEDNRKLNVEIAEFKSQTSRREDLAFKLKETEAVIDILEREKAETSREVERMRSAADLWNCKLEDANNMLEIKNKREEHERSEKVLLEDRIDELKTEAKKMKKLYEEGREALNQATKTMREIEGRSLEGVLEREKEIERLTRRNKVLGEAIGRLTGEQNEAARTMLAAPTTAHTAPAVVATPPPPAAKNVGGSRAGDKVAPDLLQTAWNWVSPGDDNNLRPPEQQDRQVEEEVDGDDEAATDENENYAAGAKWTSPPLPEVLGAFDGNVMAARQLTNPEKLRLAVASRRTEDTVSGRILYEDENERPRTRGMAGDKKGDKKKEGSKGGSQNQPRKPKLSEISAAQAAALYSK